MCLFLFLYVFQNSTICVVKRTRERGEGTAEGTQRTTPGYSLQLESNPSEPIQGQIFIEIKL
jgi:hypothetical protein